MATQWFFRLTASDVTTSDVDLALDTTRGAAATSKVTNTATGPLTDPGNQITDGGGGTTISWFTPRLNSVTITPASGTNPTFNLRGSESGMNANAALQADIYEVTDSGTEVGLIFVQANHAIAELGTSEGASNYTPNSNDSIATRTIADGNRLRFRVFIKDASGVTMGSGFTVSFFFDGPTAAASGDSYITFSETLTLFTAAANPPYRSPYPQLLAH